MGGGLGRSCTKEWGKQKRAIIPSWQIFGKVMTKPRSATRAILMNERMMLRVEECHYSQLYVVRNALLGSHQIFYSTCFNRIWQLQDSKLVCCTSRSGVEMFGLTLVTLQSQHRNPFGVV